MPRRIFLVPRADRDAWDELCPTLHEIVARIIDARGSRRVVVRSGAHVRVYER